MRRRRRRSPQHSSLLRARMHKKTFDKPYSNRRKYCSRYMYTHTHARDGGNNIHLHIANILALICRTLLGCVCVCDVYKRQRIAVRVKIKQNFMDRKDSKAIWFYLPRICTHTE